MRTCSTSETVFNVMKMFFSVSFLIMPKLVQKAGVWTAIVGLIILYAINIYSSWLLVEMRSQLRHLNIANMADIAYHLYGTPGYAIVATFQLLAVNIVLQMMLYFMGQQLD